MKKLLYTIAMIGAITIGSTAFATGGDKHYGKK